MRLNEDNVTDHLLIRKGMWKMYVEAAQSGFFEDQSVGIVWIKVWFF